jgi:delta14-sterol reductase
MLMQPGGIEKFTYLNDHFLPLTSAAMAMSVLTATWVYAWSFFSGELLALGGNSGVFIYDVRSWSHSHKCLALLT